MDPRDLKRAATELYEQGHYSGVFAVCADALAEQPEDNELRTLLIRALVALRQDSLAQRHLRDLLEREPESSFAFQMFGEIAFRGDDLAAAELYFREAWQLDRQNASARIWLDLVQGMLRTASPAQTPSTSQARLTRPKPASRRRFANGTAPTTRAPSRTALSASERATQSSRAPTNRSPSHLTPSGRAHAGRSRTAQKRARSARDSRTQSGSLSAGRLPTSRTQSGWIQAQSIMSSAPRSPQRRDDTAPVGGRFGGYLVDIGVLSKQQLSRSLAHHRRHQMRLGDAVVALGLMSQQKLDWAALGFHCRRV